MREESVEYWKSRALDSESRLDRIMELTIGFMREKGAPVNAQRLETEFELYKKEREAA